MNDKPRFIVHGATAVEWTTEERAFWAAIRKSADIVSHLPVWTQAGVVLSGNFNGGGEVMAVCERCVCACDCCIDRVRGRLVPVERAVERAEKAEARVAELENELEQVISDSVAFSGGVWNADRTVWRAHSACPESSEDGYEAWKKWFHTNAPEWIGVEDVLKELGRGEDEDQ